MSALTLMHDRRLPMPILMPMKLQLSLNMQATKNKITSLCYITKQNADETPTFLKYASNQKQNYFIVLCYKTKCMDFEKNYLSRSMAVPDSATGSCSGPGDANRGDLRNGEGIGARGRPPRPPGDNDLGRCVFTARCMLGGGAGAGADPCRGEGCSGVSDGTPCQGGDGGMSHWDSLDGADSDADWGGRSDVVSA